MQESVSGQQIHQYVSLPVPIGPDLSVETPPSLRWLRQPSAFGLALASWPHEEPI